MKNTRKHEMSREREHFEVMMRLISRNMKRNGSCTLYVQSERNRKIKVMELRLLVKKAQARDADAFTELMRLQMQNMYKAARSILSDDEDVADAVSETILTCWEKLEQLKNAALFRTWMTRILINKCNDILRKKKNVYPTAEIPDRGSLDGAYLNAEWKSALNSLDEKYRLVVMLYYVEEFSTKEIAGILEIPEATVRTRLLRARKKLAEEFYPDAAKG